ncbi:helix-turn-helix transcriptional regulator [Actinomadura atramentaria]|uniref:helix-turn-helix transcriptional regulator n=1 Tax=Actinomadura atramentaria TaxID=1990 RepID=UPI000379B8AB|nr:transcriptional regulator [Actinomadura atramentaria]
MEDIEAVGLLQDAVRRRLYEFVAAQGREVSRNEAAEAVGVARTLAAFHLDRLAAAGLLETASRRLSGRSGPGAGRPAKVYRRAAGERGVSLPPRDYRTAAELLAEAAEDARLDDAVRAAARRRGAAAGPCRDEAEARARLTERGYEPFVDADGDGGEVVRLRNCPFHALAEDFPPLVCGMNLALVEGLLGEGSGLVARMDARAGLCCVAISKNNEH